MVQTRAQRAAKRRHNPEPEDLEQNAPKRRRQRAIQGTPSPVTKPSSKRRRPSRPPESLGDAAAAGADTDDPILFWIQKSRWPSKLFKPEPDMEHVLARRPSSSSSSSRKRSHSGSSRTPSDKKAREDQSVQYGDPRYETLLATKGCFMEESELGITNESKLLCRNLLERKQSYPENTLFRDDIFDLTCRKIRNKNEARVLHDIFPLIVPSAETLATFGATHLDILTESFNEGWNNSIPLTRACPQPDYSVGFSRKAFTSEQLDKLSPFIGNAVKDLSYFMATHTMCFPFLACEVKCGNAALLAADRQNAHNMTLAARGVVELFRLVGRQNELHRQVIAFSISHDHQSVQLYGYYPVIICAKTEYYRHPVQIFNFITLDGRDKWTAYQFTKNIYDIWMPDHFRRICSAIDQLPAKVDFDVSALSELTGPSQLPKDPAPSADSASLPVQELANNAEQAVSSATSVSNTGSTKRQKKSR